jgi:hypothetical protein
MEQCHRALTSENLMRVRIPEPLKYQQDKTEVIIKGLETQGEYYSSWFDQSDLNMK